MPPPAFATTTTIRATRCSTDLAEEVARSYPELVSFADGKPQTVRYLELSAMLLNKLQTQAKENQRQAGQIQHQAHENNGCPRR